MKKTSALFLVCIALSGSLYGMDTEERQQAARLIAKQRQNYKACDKCGFDLNPDCLWRLGCGHQCDTLCMKGLGGSCPVCGKHTTQRNDAVMRPIYAKHGMTALYDKYNK